jgi:hypothetical protein
MTNINKNVALEQMRNLLEQNFVSTQFMPQKVALQQEKAVQLFRSRIFLDEIIEESIAFNKKLNFEHYNKNLKLTTTAEDLIQVFALRSEVYASIHYQDEFPDTIEGLNFDSYDTHSAIMYYKNNNVVTGSMKVIFDKGRLPSEEKFSFDYLRKEYTQLVELSRFVVKNETQGLNQEFKYLFAGVHSLFTHNEIDLVLSSIRQEHYKMYTKFGGTNIEAELKGYGKVTVPFLVISWNPSNSSKFFQKAFLHF